MKIIQKPGFGADSGFNAGCSYFYIGETKSKDDIVFTVEQDVIEEDAALKD